LLPLLTTDRLVLRQRHDDDVPAILRMDVDPEVMRFLGDGGPPDPIEHEKLVRARIHTDFGEGLGYWSAFPRDRPDDFLGYLQLTAMPGYADIEIGYRFHRAAWGRGLATEAASACLDHAFRTCALPAVVAVIHPDNIRSQRLIRKLGFGEAGRRRAYGADLLLYRLERASYLARTA
jgi:RimJ/RimL family protein N-acetyltransferase